MSEIRQIVRRVLVPVVLSLASGAGCATEPPDASDGLYTYDAGIRGPDTPSLDGSSSGGDASDSGSQSAFRDAGSDDAGTGPARDAGPTPEPDADAPAEPEDAGSDPEPREDAGAEPSVPGWADREDQGEGDGSDVVTIGDSWMSNTLGTGDAIEGALRRLGKRYRNHAVQGVMLLSRSLFGAAIPTQFDDALRANRNIKTVIMTGGGNDIIQSPGLQDDCRNGGERCEQKLKEIAEGLEALWAKMANAGVEDVVHIGYARDAGSSGDSAADASKNGILELCNAAPLHCHLIDSTPLVMGQFTDGIHPTRAANDRMAKAIYDLMKERKIRR